MDEEQNQTETKNAAPENQPPASMPVTKQPMHRPAQCKQGSPLEKDYRDGRKGEKEGHIHVDFLFAFCRDTPAAVWLMSFRSAGLMSLVSTSWATNSRVEPPAKTRAKVCIVVSSNVALGMRAA